MATENVISVEYMKGFVEALKHKRNGVERIRDFFNSSSDEYEALTKQYEDMNVEIDLLNRLIERNDGDR